MLHYESYISGDVEFAVRSTIRDRVIRQSLFRAVKTDLFCRHAWMIFDDFRFIRSTKNSSK